MDYVEGGDTRNLKGNKDANKRTNQRDIQERKYKLLLRKDQAEAEKEKNKIQIVEDSDLNSKSKKLEEKKENTASKKKEYEDDMEKCAPKIKGKHPISNNR